jgi:hypothetical protein
MALCGRGSAGSGSTGRVGKAAQGREPLRVAWEACGAFCSIVSSTIGRVESVRFRCASPRLLLVPLRRTQFSEWCPQVRAQGEGAETGGNHTDGVHRNRTRILSSLPALLLTRLPPHWPPGLLAWRFLFAVGRPIRVNGQDSRAEQQQQPAEESRPDGSRGTTGRQTMRHADDALMWLACCVPSMTVAESLLPLLLPFPFLFAVGVPTRHERTGSVCMLHCSACKPHADEGRRLTPCAPCDWFLRLCVQVLNRCTVRRLCRIRQ